jgi:hypothetical protein
MDEMLGVIENEDGVGTVAKHRRECIDIVRGAAPVTELDVDGKLLHSDTAPLSIAPQSTHPCIRPVCSEAGDVTAVRRGFQQEIELLSEKCRAGVGRNPGDAAARAG